MKPFFYLFLLVGFSCSKPEEKSNEPPPMRSQICFTIEPKNAELKVQGTRPDRDGCVETFAGEISVEAKAPGYKTYQQLLLIEGHARREYIVLEKLPTNEPANIISASQPASTRSASQPASTNPVSQPKP